MMKRIFDILFSLVVLIFFSPLFLSVAIAIKIGSKGPVFYLSPRVGKQERTFKCWKFRTMCQGADSLLTEMLKNPVTKEEFGTYAKLKKDPRITKVGKWLRKTSLDELPQFWNVLKGDLSVVGPRPFLVEEVGNHLGSRKKKILSLRPGITGLWQTSGRSSLTFEERVFLEERYVEVHSFVLDLFLICKTIPLVLRTKGAF